MATPLFVPVPTSASGGVENVTKQAIGAGASGAEIVLGNRQIFSIVAIAAATAAAPLNINVKFGVAGLSAAANTDMGLPFGTVFQFDTGEEFSSIRVFCNSTTAGCDLYVCKLTRT